MKVGGGSLTGDGLPETGEVTGAGNGTETGEVTGAGTEVDTDVRDAETDTAMETGAGTA